MNGYDVAQTLLDIIAANVATLNANEDLDASGFALSLAPEDLDGSTDLFRFLKVEDREIMPDGLNVFVTPDEERDYKRFSGWMTQKEITVYISCYLAGPTANGAGGVDMEKVKRAKKGLLEGMVSLLNRRDFQTKMDTPAGGVYGGRVVGRLPGDQIFKPSMGGVVRGIVLTWKGIYAVTETETSGTESAG